MTYSVRIFRQDEEMPIKAKQYNLNPVYPVFPVKKVLLNRNNQVCL